MSAATKYAEAIIRLDEARDNISSLIRPAGALHEATTLLLQRIQEAWGYLPEEQHGLLRKQAEKALAFEASVRDFRDYMSEPGAWTPAKEDVT